eukprot:1594962-Karenia_brevis.AAC.1
MLAAQRNSHLVYNLLIDTTKFVVMPFSRTPDEAYAGSNEVAAQHAVVHWKVPDEETQCCSHHS